MGRGKSYDGKVTAHRADPSEKCVSPRPLSYGWTLAQSIVDYFIGKGHSVCCALDDVFSSHDAFHLSFCTNVIAVIRQARVRLVSQDVAYDTSCRDLDGEEY